MKNWRQIRHQYFTNIWLFGVTANHDTATYARPEAARSNEIKATSAEEKCLLRPHIMKLFLLYICKKTLLGCFEGIWRVFYKVTSKVVLQPFPRKSTTFAELVKSNGKFRSKTPNLKFHCRKIRVVRVGRKCWDRIQVTFWGEPKPRGKELATAFNCMIRTDIIHSFTSCTQKINVPLKVPNSITTSACRAFSVNWKFYTLAKQWYLNLVRCRTWKRKAHPCGNVRVDPVLPVIVYSVAEVDEHGHKGGEVSKGGACCEPELLRKGFSMSTTWFHFLQTHPHQPVDPQLVEWLG